VKKNILIWVLVIFLAVNIVANAYLLLVNNRIHDRMLAAEELNEMCSMDACAAKGQTLSLDAAWQGVDIYLKRQAIINSKYESTKNVISLLFQNAKGDFAVYFEELNSGAFFGINETEEFVPLSLLKVPTMIATLKEVELGKVPINQKVVLNAEDIDEKSGNLWMKGAGYTIPIKDLLTVLIRDSDNTAVLTLDRRIISDEVFIESRIGMGLPAPTEIDAKITPIDYANMLRDLYYSNYLRRPFSELALSIMLNTDFNSQIPAGVPEGVKISHKVGFFIQEGYFHDCGIVYLPGNPYIICMMSKNTDIDEANRVMRQTSKIVYDAALSNSQHNTTITN
jgi:beta-lactamase class A